MLYNLTQKLLKSLRFKVLISIILFAPLCLYADNADLQSQRVNVIKQYVHLLGKGKYKVIPQLFTKDAIATSSSSISDNVVNFYKVLFTQTISQPKSQLINIFTETQNKNMLVGLFDFSWINKDGQAVSAKFLDLFIFEKNSKKIKNIFVFSNTFKQDIMKLLE